MGHLVEEHSSVDPTYVEDFLLTYRTFLKSPLEITDHLLNWFNDAQHRDRVSAESLLHCGFERDGRWTLLLAASKNRANTGVRFGNNKCFRQLCVFLR